MWYFNLIVFVIKRDRLILFSYKNSKQRLITKSLKFKDYTVKKVYKILFLIIF